MEIPKIHNEVLKLSHVPKNSLKTESFETDRYQYSVDVLVLSISFDQSEFSCRLKKLRSQAHQPDKTVARKTENIYFKEINRLLQIIRQSKVSSISRAKTQISRQITSSQNCLSKQSEFPFLV